jgi:hypothetical protein
MAFLRRSERRGPSFSARQLVVDVRDLGRLERGDRDPGLGGELRILSPAPGSNRSGARKETRLLIRTVFGIVLGAALGFGLHRLVGCRTGACPIWASPYVSTLYGALLGFLLSR